MTGKMNRKEVLQRKRARVKRPSSHTWRIEDAARFLFKAQCYDAGPDSETKCGLCGAQIRLCYVLKVLESVDLLASEVGKLTIGECCFQRTKTVNEKLYPQLLAAAINLRTFMEAVDRDKRVFAGVVPDELKCQASLLGLDDELAFHTFEPVIGEGADHA